MKKIRFNGIDVGVYFYTDYDKFKTSHCPKDYIRESTTVGLQSGNGIWVDMEKETWKKTLVHEISHVLDTILVEYFEITDIMQASELRARMSGYIYKEAVKYIDKNKK